MAQLGDLFDEAFACEERGDYRDALELWDRIVKEDPGYRSAAYNRGVCLFRLGELHAAIEAFTMAIEVNPQDAGAFYNRGVARRKKADQAGFVAAFADDKRSISEPAQTFIRQALADYSEAIRIAPKHWYYMNRATCHRYLGNDSDAIADAKQAAAMGDAHAKRFLRDEMRIDLDEFE